MRDPVAEIDEMISAREPWSDARVLAELTVLEPLPQEDVFCAEGADTSAVWLGILRHPIGLPALIVALDDPQPYDPARATVQGNATRAIQLLARAHPRLAPEVIAALRARGRREPEGSFFEKQARETTGELGVSSGCAADPSPR